MEILRGRGNADVEAVVIAGHDVERVLAFAALRASKASTRTGPLCGRGDDGRGSRMDAGDADVEVVVVARLDGDRVLVLASLRVCEASTRASGRARADEATTDGDPGWTREMLT